MPVPTSTMLCGPLNMIGEYQTQHSTSLVEKHPYRLQRKVSTCYGLLNTYVDVVGAMYRVKYLCLCHLSKYQDRSLVTFGSFVGQWWEVHVVPISEWFGVDQPVRAMERAARPVH